MTRSVAQLDKRIKQFQEAYRDKDFRQFLNKEEIQAALTLVLETWDTYEEKSSYAEPVNEAYDLLITTLAAAHITRKPAPGFTVTPLSLAVDGHLDVLVYDLLEKNADPNSTFDTNTPLHEAILNHFSRSGTQSLNIIKILLRHPKTQRDLTNNNSRTALQEAQHHQKNDIAALFDDSANLDLPENWDIEVSTANNETPRKIPEHNMLRRPQYNKSLLLRVVNYSNRQGIEVFVDFFINWTSTWAYYRTKQINANQIVLVPLRKAIPHAVCGFLIRAALLFITTPIYVLSRLGYLLGFGARPKDKMAPTRNPYKSEYMGVAIMTMTGMVFELTIELITPASLQTLAHGFGMAGSGTGAYVVGAVLMTAMIMITTAFLLHAAKLRAKMDNAMVLPPPSASPELKIVSITSPKHYPIVDPGVPDEFKSLQKTVLYYHQVKKRPAIYGTTPEQEAIKTVLTEFENVGKAYSKGVLEQHDIDCLVTAAIDQQATTGNQLADNLRKFKVEDKKIVKVKC